jgi:hypothetical protein
MMYKLSVGHVKKFYVFFLQRSVFDKIQSNFLLNQLVIGCQIF